MKLKLDENLGRRGAKVLIAAGHDVATVVEQSMMSASDSTLIERCSEEGRILVTMDLDFSNPIHFPPAKYSGIAVLRPSTRPSLSQIEELAATLAEALIRSSLEGKLWIVEVGRIREYTPEET